MKNSIRMKIQKSMRRAISDTGKGTVVEEPVTCRTAHKCDLWLKGKPVNTKKSTYQL